MFIVVCYATSEKTACKLKWFSRFVPEKLQSISILGWLLFAVYLVLNAVVGDLSDLLNSFSDYEDNIVAIATIIERMFHLDLQAEILSLKLGCS
ncbi:MAG: hypothetical protein CR991_03800 [Proteobacteria bacterium]|nr:MAG: hypothetical protein CR991_03800 [Pseudomonadota bacterium]